MSWLKNLGLKIWFFSKIDRPGDYQTKWNKSDRERQIYDIAYIQNQISQRVGHDWATDLIWYTESKKKKILRNLFTKQTHRLKERNYDYKG